MWATMPVSAGGRGVVLAFFCKALVCVQQGTALPSLPGRRDIIWGAGCSSALLLCEVGC